MTMAWAAWVRVLAMVALCSGTSGCSVGMALSGEEHPDLSAVRIGAQRGEIELHLARISQTRKREGCFERDWCGGGGG